MGYIDDHDLDETEDFNLNQKNKSKNKLKPNPKKQMESEEVAAVKKWLKENLRITTNMEREQFSNLHRVTVKIEIEDTVVSEDSFSIEQK